MERPSTYTATRREPDVRARDRAVAWGLQRPPGEAMPLVSFSVRFGGALMASSGLTASKLAGS